MSRLARAAAALEAVEPPDSRRRGIEAPQPHRGQFRRW